MRPVARRAALEAAAEQQVAPAFEAHQRIDRLVVTWSDGRRTELENVAADQILVVRQELESR